MNILIIILFVLLLLISIYLIIQVSIIKAENNLIKQLVRDIVLAQSIDKETGVAEELYIQHVVNIIRSLLIDDKQKPKKEREFF